MNKFTVYILRTDRNTLYTGQTNDLKRRLEMHKRGQGAKYMRAFKSFELVYQEEMSTLSQALKREWEIKQWPRLKKLALVEQAVGTQGVLTRSNQYLYKRGSRHKTETKIK